MTINKALLALALGHAMAANAPPAPTTTTTQDVSLRNQILDISRQASMGPLSPWFSDQLDRQISSGRYLPEEKLVQVSQHLVDLLSAYRQQAVVSTCVLGMSGGVDSALTAALFKKAGWKVMGVTLPIHQEPAETERGLETIQALGLDEHVHVDLSQAYDAMLGHMGDPELTDGSLTSKTVKIRRGNVRARLRMVTLYNLASKNGGLVASTDNLSELMGSFFTLHGDVGDVSPIQSLTKSWEVPYLARLNGVPEATVRAHPTDGLGIDAGDEAQLGCSYLEWDVLANAIFDEAKPGLSAAALAGVLGVKGPDRVKFDAVFSRMKNGWFKRHNPMNFNHPLTDRFAMVDRIDHRMFMPRSFARLI